MSRADPPFRGDPIGELCWPLELAHLLADPTFRGHGVPRGDGRSVLLLPGFLVSDLTLQLLGRFLRTIGYRPTTAGIRFNHGCGASYDPRLLESVYRLRAKSGRRVAVVGHSRGGHFARSLGARAPDAISHVVMLGAGHSDVFDVAPMTAFAAGIVRHALLACDEQRRFHGCNTDGCTCEFQRGFVQPFPPEVALFSVYSRSDGVLRWQTCVADDAECIEVSGSHIGLAFNRQAYRAIAECLAR